MNQSDEHAILVELFRRHPELILKLVDGVPGLTFPPESRARSVDPIVQLDPLAPDVVIELQAPDGKPLVTFIIEAQRAPKPDKLLKWPAMQWNERYRRGCDCHVVVVTTSRRVAAWASRPIRCGDSVTQLLVRGPDQVPRITDPIVAAADPELAVLSATMHAADPDGIDIVGAALSSLRGLHPSEARMYIHYLNRGLAAMAFHTLDIQNMKYIEILDNWPFDERNMPYPAFDVLIRPVLVQERSTQLLRILPLRDFTVTDELRERVTSCNDLYLLKTWIDRAVTAATIDEVFAP